MTRVWQEQKLIACKFGNYFRFPKAYTRLTREYRFCKEANVGYGVRGLRRSTRGWMFLFPSLVLTHTRNTANVLRQEANCLKPKAIDMLPSSKEVGARKGLSGVGCSRISGWLHCASVLSDSVSCLSFCCPDLCRWRWISFC